MATLTISPPSSRSNEFWAGVRAEIPLLVGVFPFGMIFGVLALGAGIPSGIAQAMSSVIFAGSSQFVMAQLVGSGTPALVIVLTIAVVNLRHALYSASISPYVKHLPGSWKAFLAYLLTDEAYAVAILKYERDGESSFRHWYFLGAGLALWTCWQISTALGIFLGAVIPASWSLDFTLALTFIALVVPALKDRPAAAAALVAAVTAVLAYGLPYKLGLILAALVGILAGLLLEGRK
jgi:4-azaleucine resistance transporter AzlC